MKDFWRDFVLPVWPCVDHFKFPTFLIFIAVTYKPLARTQNPFSGGKKQQHQTTFKHQGIFISKLFYNLSKSFLSKAKIRISHTKPYKILKILLLIFFTTNTELGLPVAGRVSGGLKAIGEKVEEMLPKYCQYYILSQGEVAGILVKNASS